MLFNVRELHDLSRQLLDLETVELFRVSSLFKHLMRSLDSFLIRQAGKRFDGGHVSASHKKAAHEAFLLN
jgi:hypothetical protein